MNERKDIGFTLIELLIVIAILAALSTLTILIFNPSEVLAQGRDQARISDLNTIKAALQLYIIDKPGSFALVTGGGACTKTTSAAPNNSTGSFIDYASKTPANGTFKRGANTGSTAAGNDTCVLATESRSNSTGWLQVDLTNLSGGIPFGQLPLDPVDSGDQVYRANFAGNTAGTIAVAPSGMYYEVDALMESKKFTSTTSAAATDGGDKNNCNGNGLSDFCIYEVGNVSAAIL